MKAQIAFNENHRLDLEVDAGVVWITVTGSGGATTRIPLWADGAECTAKLLELAAKYARGSQK